MQEQWRPVVGYEGWYSISNLGRVRRDAPGSGTWPGRLIKPVRHHNGYLMVKLSRNHDVWQPFIHQLVAAAFIGPPESGKQVNHKNGVKPDNQAANIEWETPVGNTQHAIKSGLRSKSPGGEAHPAAKLTASQVIELRSLRQTGISFSALGRQFGVCAMQAYRIVKGQRWAHGATP